jgi:hypothetical protein
MDLASWLRSLGFENYEGAFRENAIDLGILPDLNADNSERWVFRLAIA